MQVGIGFADYAPARHSASTLASALAYTQNWHSSALAYTQNISSFFPNYSVIRNFFCNFAENLCY